jgi:RNase H
LKKGSLITDGSCLGNPGQGGWACVLRCGGVKKEFFGFDPHTTNNRMEKDGRPHSPLRLALAANYIPPKPQPSLFEDAEPDSMDRDDEEDLGLSLG